VGCDDPLAVAATTVARRGISLVVPVLWRGAISTAYFSPIVGQRVARRIVELLEDATRHMSAQALGHRGGLGHRSGRLGQIAPGRR
jgi:hypothetical protein